MGLWLDTIIFADGKKFAHSDLPEQKYRGRTNVIVTEDETPEDYICQYGGNERDCEGQIVVDYARQHPEEYFNPDHILSMTFEGSLYDLLNTEEDYLHWETFQIELNDIFWSMKKMCRTLYMIF